MFVESGKKMDVRVYGTKNRIINGLFQCIKEKPFNSVLNRDIISKAEISSRTFYRHYSDKNQVICEFEDKFADGLTEAFAKDRKALAKLGHNPSKADVYEVANTAFHHTMIFCDEYKKEGKLLLSPNGDIRFSWLIRRTSEKEFFIRAKYIYGDHTIPKNNPHHTMIQKIYVGSIVSAIETWLTYSDEVPQQDARKILADLQVLSPMEVMNKVGI